MCTVCWDLSSEAGEVRQDVFLRITTGFIICAMFSRWNSDNSLRSNSRSNTGCNSAVKLLDGGFSWVFWRSLFEGGEHRWPPIIKHKNLFGSLCCLFPSLNFFTPSKHSHKHVTNRNTQPQSLGWLLFSLYIKEPRKYWRNLRYVCLLFALALPRKIQIHLAFSSSQFWSFQYLCDTKSYVFRKYQSL